MTSRKPWLYAGALGGILAFLISCSCPSGTAARDAGTTTGSSGCDWQGDLFVDAALGSDGDGGCCGIRSRPCQTLSHAVELISSGRVEGVTLHASVDGGGGVWTDREHWPVPLFLGASLVAPDVFFLAPPRATPYCTTDLDANSAFVVRQFDLDDVAPVTIEGDPDPDGGYIHIGIPMGSGPPSSDFSDAIDDRSLGIDAGDSPASDWLYPLPVVVSHAWLGAVCSGIDVGLGGDLTIGPLPVHIGSWDGRKTLNFNNSAGISCVAAPYSPASLRDSADGDLQIDSVGGGVVLSFCSALLAHAPVIGRTPDGGYNSCPNPVLLDVDGVVLDKGASAVIGSPGAPATIQCQAEAGVLLTETTDAPGSVNFTGTISNIACYGIEAIDGFVAIFNSAISYCKAGVWVGDGADVGVDLSGGPLGLSFPPSIISCISNDEDEGISHSGCAYGYEGVIYGPTGAALINSGRSTVNAENVLWQTWDPSSRTPQTWMCGDAGDVGYADCHCVSGGCEDAGAASLFLTDTTAAYVEGNADPFDFDGGGLANIDCR